MTYSNKVPTYKIDLSKSPSQRWAQVIKKEGERARALGEEALDSFGPAAHLAGLLRGLYQLSGGRYVEEMDSWSKAMGISKNKLVMLQCSYELAQAAERLGGPALKGLRRVLGCTAGVVDVPGGPVHVRTLDWPLENLGPATCIFEFRRGKRSFYSVGAAGFVGVLSGMLPGAYSVTINYAPPAETPGFDFGPSFLLREVLEDCDHYDEAVEYLSGTKLAAPVFFTVCGAEPGEGCVIERTRNDAVVRRLKRGGLLVQANHHVAPRFKKRNEVFDGDEESVLAYSKEREDALRRELSMLTARPSIERVFSCLEEEPVCNEESYQLMAFRPAKGEYVVQRFDEEDE